KIGSSAGPGTMPDAPSPGRLSHPWAVVMFQQGSFQSEVPLISSFYRDGLNFHYREAGDGLPFVFQHGLGGDVSQPFGLFRPPPGFRLLAFDCRGHGETRPLGDPEKVGIAPIADDLLALLDHLRIGRAVIGGISMGAAVALNFTLRYPQRVAGLVL